MGQKLFLDIDDPLFDGLRNKPVGICGGCYCCGRQLHIEFVNLNVLPNARVNEELFQILICDDCEEDVEELENDGIENVSYDILFQLQEELQHKLNTPETTDRFEILKKLYVAYENRYRKLKG